MITCQECLEKMKPDDPRVPTGRYHHSSCDYFCNKPTYYKEIEKAIPEIQLRAVVMHLQSKFNTHIDISKKRGGGFIPF